MINCHTLVKSYLAGHSHYPQRQLLHVPSGVLSNILSVDELADSLDTKSFVLLEEMRSQVSDISTVYPQTRCWLETLLDNVYFARGEGGHGQTLRKDG